MPPTTPYTHDLDGREPLGAIRDTSARIRARAGGWSPADFEHSYAPGKWSARQILIHLAQSEMALGYRARMTVTVPGYAAQSFDQDLWMQHESQTSGHDALDAFLGLAAMNAAFFDTLTESERAQTLTHPDYGSLTVDWIIHQIAGHQIHHSKQLDLIAAK